VTGRVFAHRAASTTTPWGTPGALMPRYREIRGGWVP